MATTSASPARPITTSEFEILLRKANAKCNIDYSIGNTSIGVYAQVYLRDIHDDLIWQLGDWILVDRNRRRSDSFTTNPTPRPGRITFRVPMEIWNELKNKPWFTFVEDLRDYKGPLVVFSPDENQKSPDISSQP